MSARVGRAACRHLWGPTLGDERGSVLLLGLVMVFVMTLLGVALFDLTTIEAGLVRGDLSDAQAFYCAETALAYTYGNPTRTATIGALGPGATLTYQGVSAGGANVSTVNGAYPVTVIATGGTTPTITATCTLPNGTSRTVRLGLTYLNSGYEFAATSGGGDFYLGGTGAPTKSGSSNYVGGADKVNGDIYASGTVALRGDAAIIPCHSTSPPCDPSDNNPAITSAAVAGSSTAFNPSAPGNYGTGTKAMPSVTGIVDDIRAAVTVNGQPVMTGTYNGSTVYNLSKIFATLGTTNEGNIERNLARPSGCTFGVATTDPKCQVWQDLVYVGIKSTTSDPGPTDATSYYFMGIPRAASSTPQQTSFPALYYAMVNASAELRQMGFTPGTGTGTNMGNLGSRLDALAGQDTANLVVNEGNIPRLVDFTVRTDASGTTVLRPKPPIFFADDGHFRVADGTNYAFNGMATVVTTKSIILSDNIIYLNGKDNANVTLPASCADSNDRTGCGVADGLGLVAQNDIWIGDSGNAGQTVQFVSGVMLAGRDINYLDYTSSSSCCGGPANPITVNGTLMAVRDLTLARDWSDPRTNKDSSTCDSAGGRCRPIRYFPNDTSCGVTGCWKYLTIDTVVGSATYGALIVDSALASFKGGCEAPAYPPGTTCPAGTRRVTHFQLNINYDKRFWNNAALIPPGLPAGGNKIFQRIAAGTWKDCGANPQCS